MPEFIITTDENTSYHMVTENENKKIKIKKIDNYIDNEYNEGLKCKMSLECSTIVKNMFPGKIIIDNYVLFKGKRVIDKHLYVFNDNTVVLIKILPFPYNCLEDIYQEDIEIGKIRILF